LTPTSGPVGTAVTISGSGFTGTTSVKFNGIAATYQVNSDAQITATVPSGATGGPIKVTTPLSTATSSTSFSVTATPPSVGPTIASLTPTSGPVGTAVTISGSGVTGTTSVKFNGTAATYQVNSDAQINATVPSGATSGAIMVTTPAGTATSSTSFGVTTPSATTGSGGTTGIPDTHPPSAPTNLTATFGNGQKVTLSWTASTDDVGVAGYKLYRDEKLSETVTGTSFEDMLVGGRTTSAAYYVRAIDAAGNVSAASEILIVAG
jgi:hypothetical protein